MDAMVKKIPVCKHVFHTLCLDNWLKSRAEEARESVHKCPLCNTEINSQNLKEANEAMQKP